MNDIRKDFQILIKEFYPQERIDQKLSGGLHLVVVYDGIELISLRGIHCVKNADNSWHFGLPLKHGRCHRTGVAIPYKIFRFCDETMNQKLLNEIHEKGVVFIEQWLESHSQCSIIEKKRPGSQKPKEGTAPVLTINNATEAKTNGTIAKKKQWVDPPPLKKRAISRRH